MVTAMFNPISAEQAQETTADPILAAIESRLDELEAEMAKYDDLHDERERLRNAKRALSPKTSSPSGAAVSANAVFEAIPQRGEIKRAELAKKLGVERSAIGDAIKELKAADQIVTSVAGAGPVKRAKSAA